MRQFFFSGHADKNEIKSLIKKTKPEHLIIQHGDVESVEAIGEWAKKNTNCKVYMPNVDDAYRF